MKKKQKKKQKKQQQNKNKQNKEKNKQRLQQPKRDFTKIVKLQQMEPLTDQTRI